MGLNADLCEWYDVVGGSYRACQRQKIVEINDELLRLCKRHAKERFAKTKKELAKLTLEYEQLATVLVPPGASSARRRLRALRRSST